MSSLSMTRSLTVITGSCWLLLVVFGGHGLVAQERMTWFQSLTGQETEVLPHDLQFHSLSVSRLPVDDNGKTQAPDGGPSKVGLVPRGIAIYGTFEFADRMPENLTALPAEQVTRFIDDQGLDLRPAVSIGRGRERRAFASASVPRETKVIGFLMAAPNPPSPVATRVSAAATLLFQTMHDERTDQQALQISEETALPSSVGPLRYTCTDVEGHTPSDPREQRLFARVNPKYRLVLEPRKNPVKLIELLDKDGRVIDNDRYPGRPRGAWRGPLVKGDETNWFVPSCKTTPTTIRITWYEHVARLKVPIEVSASLGLNQQ